MPDRPNWKISWKEALLLALVTLVAYGPGMWNGFVYDDVPDILENPGAHAPLKLGKIFTEAFPPGDTGRGLYRPLLTVSYYVDGVLWGFPAAGHWNGFHLTDLALHTLNALLFLALLRRLAVERGPAVVSALVFAVHPVLAESVAWISGRAEVLGMTFGLTALLVFLNRPQGAGLAASLALWVLAMFCKENWLMLPALAALVCFCVPCAPKFDLRGVVRYGFVTAILAGIFWYLRYRSIGSLTPPVSAYGSVEFFPRIFTALRVLWNYVGLWLWPGALTVYHDDRIVDSWRLGAFLVASWAFALWLAWRARQYFPWLTLAVGWFCIGIFPVSNLVVRIGAISAERFVYMPTLFFAPAIILGALHVLRVGVVERFRRPVAIVLASVWCVILFVRVSGRVDDWQSNMSLWMAASRCTPGAYAVKAQLAMSYFHKGDYALARVLAIEAMEQAERNPQPYQKYFTPILRSIAAGAEAGKSLLGYQERLKAANDLARDLLGRRLLSKTVDYHEDLAPRMTETLDAYRRLIEDFPEQPMAFEARGDLYTRLDNPVAAYRDFHEAVRLGANTSDIRVKYGKSLSDLNFKAEALTEYDRALRINPMNHIVHYYRGVVLTDLLQYEDALAEFRKTSEFLPTLPEPRLNAAGLLLHLKRPKEARAEINEVLARDPKNELALKFLQRLQQP